MDTILLPSLAPMLGVFGLGGGELILIMFAMLLFATPFVLLLLVFGWARLNRRQTNEAFNKLAASGAPGEPEALLQSSQKAARHFDLRVGIILVMTGIGVGAGLLAYGRNPGLGLVPFCVGLGFLITSQLKSGTT
jgi:hypothetical protein